MTNTNATKTTATATYRMPREGREASSRILSMTWDGSTCRMSGGKWGAHQILATDEATVRAHWAGYVSNNRGRSVKPAIQWYREPAEKPDTDLSWLPNQGAGIDAMHAKLERIRGGFKITRPVCPVCGEPPFGGEYCCGHEQGAR